MAMTIHAQQTPPAKVRTVARLMAVVCTVLAVAGPLAVAAFMLQVVIDDAAWHGFLVEVLGGQYRPVVSAPLWSRLAVAFVVLVSVALAGYGLWQLRGFFRCVYDGAALSVAAAGHLTGFARIIAILALAKPVTSALVSVLATLPNPPGERQLIIRFSSDDVIALVVGILLVVVAWTPREGARIARENAEFV